MTAFKDEANAVGRRAIGPYVGSSRGSLSPAADRWDPQLPEFLSDVEVTSEGVPQELEGATSRGVLWQAATGRFLLDVPEVARYLVAGGREITIDPVPGAGAGRAMQFLRATPLAALLYQRGMLALQAAAAVGPRGAVLLAGDSASGKSTLLAALLERGWTFLADDLTPVDLDEAGCPIALPCHHEIQLWRNSMKRSALFGPAGPSSDGPVAGRVTLDCREQFTPEPMPIVAVYLLTVSKVAEISEEEIVDAQRYQNVRFMTYNTRIAAALLNRSEAFKRETALARSIPVRQLRRPSGKWSLAALADRVEALCG